MISQTVKNDLLKVFMLFFVAGILLIIFIMVLFMSLLGISLSDEQQESVNKTDINISGDLGSLSAKYESSGNPETIADTPGDPGGKSYGVYQFAANVGSLNSFLMWLSNVEPNMHNRLLAAKNIDGGYGRNFDAVWIQIANADPQSFYNIQHTYIKGSYFDPVVSHFKEKGFNIEVRSKALQNVVWSTAVQHGVGGAKIIIGKQDLNNSDREIITGIYNERMKVNIYFISSSAAVKRSVYNRFKTELQDALAMLEAEGG